MMGQPLRYTISTNTEPLRRERMTHMNRDMTQLAQALEPVGLDAAALLKA